MIDNIVERFGVPYLVGRIMSVVSDLYERPLNAANLLKTYVVHLSSNDLSELPISSVKCKGMLIPIANNDKTSDSDDPPMPDTCFAVFPLLMQDKFR